ncbi:ABC transporter ATP-binding protein [Rheinheimera sp.]|uniref:ABC transporter ATP-binding protein n=1 Tax=Rheinheimera sp. TaxID=1869214 RepID=UPI003AF82D1C
MTTPTSDLIATQLTKKVQLSEGTLTIVQDINLSIPAGASVAIVGASGSGKSTLLGLLAGLDTPSSGECFLNGQPLHQMTEDERAALRAKTVGFVFQQFLLLPSLTALENVTLPAELAGMKEARQRGLELLEQVGLSHRADFYPGQMSGGEQQRVAIARAFITNPQVLFADEPSANLDNATGSKVEDLLFQLNSQQGTTLVLVTHNDELAQRCQFRYRMHAGQLTVVSSEQSEAQRHVG